jgi:nitronate monooxygenase
MWQDTRLTELLGLEVPIIQAPMLGSTTPALAAAVSNAGGLGSIGGAAMTADQVKGLGAELRALSNGAFNLNFFAHRAPKRDEAARRRAADRLEPWYARFELGAPPVDLKEPWPPFGEAVLEALLVLAPPVVSFHFGLPEGNAVARLQATGSRVICTATTVAEARSLEADGVDAIIAQGWEAGGHRGAFEIEGDDVGVGLMSLLPQMVDAVAVPVIAAGGIADGRGIAAALMLGASGVQMGTAFLSCPETNIPDIHRRGLAEATDESTRLTRAHSGRPARGRNTRYFAEMAKHAPALPEFPLMYSLSAPLRSAEDTDQSLDFQFLLYGQSAPMGRSLPASELMARLVDETTDAYRAMSARS